MKESKKLTAAKKAGLKVTDIDPKKNAKLNDFMEHTEGTGKPVDQVYSELGLGSRKPRDSKLAKRYDAARKRLRSKGLL